MVQKMIAQTLLFLISALAAAPAFAFVAATAAEESRTVFVQLFEWPWNDVARECEIYLGPAGFSAVQVSPPHEHLVWQNTPWWERYQVISYKLESRSGNEAEFIDMVQRCKKAGVDVYADVIINHMAGVSEGRGFSGTPFKHYEYPGLYSYNDFHHCGRNGNDDIANWNDIFEVRFCELLDLADLATESKHVQSSLGAYMNRLLDIGVSGFRLDAAKHVPAEDIRGILSYVKRPVYIYQEVITSAYEPVKFAEYFETGDVTAYNYPYYLGNAFKNGNPHQLTQVSAGQPPSELAVVFVTNHDLERVPDLSSLLTYTKEQHLYRLAQIFMLTWPFGYPQVYSGFAFTDYNQGPPVDKNLKTLPVLREDNSCVEPFTCEHRLPEVAALVFFRNQTNTNFYVKNWWTNGSNQISFSRGNMGFVAINYSGEIMIQNFKTHLLQGTYCNLTGVEFDVTNKTCSSGIKVDRSGYVHVEIQPFSSIVLLKNVLAGKK